LSGGGTHIPGLGWGANAVIGESVDLVEVDLIVAVGESFIANAESKEFHDVDTVEVFVVVVFAIYLLIIC